MRSNLSSPGDTARRKRKKRHERRRRYHGAVVVNRFRHTQEIADLLKLVIDDGIVASEKEELYAACFSNGMDAIMTGEFDKARVDFTHCLREFGGEQDAVVLSTSHTPKDPALPGAAPADDDEVGSPLAPTVVTLGQRVLAQVALGMARLAAAEESKAKHDASGAEEEWNPVNILDAK